MRLPALRERPEDLPLLIEAILNGADLTTAPESQIVRTPAFVASLARHAWAGNVRELRNYVERCLALAERAPLDADESKSPEEPALDVREPLKHVRERALAAVERRYLETIMAAHDGNVSAASQAAGVDRTHFYRLLWRHGLR